MILLNLQQNARYAECLTPERVDRLDRTKADTLAGSPMESDKAFVAHFFPKAKCVRDDVYTDHWKIVDFDGLQLGQLAKSSRDAWSSVTVALFSARAILGTKVG